MTRKITASKGLIICQAAIPRRKTGNKEKTGKAEIAIFVFPACPAFMIAALPAGKSGFLGLFILSHTFRKNGVSVSDNDLWGMIQNPADRKKWESSGPQVPPDVAGRPAYPGILQRKRGRNYEAADAARVAGK